MNIEFSVSSPTPQSLPENYHLHFPFHALSDQEESWSGEFLFPWIATRIQAFGVR